MYVSRSRYESPSVSTLATSGVPSSSSTLYTSPMQPPPIGRALFRRSPKEASTPEAMIRSATGVLVPDLLQETLRGFFDEIQDVLETARSAVVRVWDLALWRVGREVEERADHAFPRQSTETPCSYPRPSSVCSRTSRSLRGRVGGPTGPRCLFRGRARSPAPSGPATHPHDRSRGCQQSLPLSRQPDPRAARRSQKHLVPSGCGNTHASPTHEPCRLHIRAFAC